MFKSSNLRKKRLNFLKAFLKGTLGKGIPGLKSSLAKKKQ
jgi:hypothetical protein